MMVVRRTIENAEGKTLSGEEDFEDIAVVLLAIVLLLLHVAKQDR